MLQIMTLPKFVARRRRWLATLPLALAMLLLAASPVAAAGTLIPASGSFVEVSFVQSNVRGVGGITLFDFTATDTLSGTLSGTSVVQGSCVVRASSQGVCHALETFTGSVAGRSGTAIFRDVLFLDLATGASRGSFAVVGGTGNLATLRGYGTFEGRGTGPYTGEVSVGP